MLCCVTPTRSHLFFSLSLTICFIYDSVYFVQPIQKHCKKQRPQHQIKSLQKYIYTSHITKEIQFRVENESEHRTLPRRLDINLIASTENLDVAEYSILKIPHLILAPVIAFLSGHRHSLPRIYVGQLFGRDMT